MWNIVFSDIQAGHFSTKICPKYSVRSYVATTKPISWNFNIKILFFFQYTFSSNLASSSKWFRINLFYILSVVWKKSCGAYFILFPLDMYITEEVCIYFAGISYSLRPMGASCTPVRLIWQGDLYVGKYDICYEIIILLKYFHSMLWAI